MDEKSNDVVRFRTLEIVSGKAQKVIRTVFTEIFGATLSADAFDDEQARWVVGIMSAEKQDDDVSSEQDKTKEEQQQPKQQSQTFVSLCRWRPLTAPLQSALFLSNFGVVPGHRRRGFGRRMLQYVLDQPEVKAVRDLYLFVPSDNAVAQGLYRSQGFRRAVFCLAPFELRTMPREPGALLFHQSKSGSSITTTTAVGFAIEKLSVQFVVLVMALLVVMLTAAGAGLYLM